MTRRALLCAACSLCTCSTLPVKFALEAWPALYDRKSDRRRTRSITGRWCLGSAGCALLLLLLPGQPLIHSRPRRMQSTQQIWPCRTRPLPSFRSAALVLSMQPKWSTLRQKPWADDSSGSHGSTTPYRMPHTAYRQTSRHGRQDKALSRNFLAVTLRPPGPSLALFTPPAALPLPSTPVSSDNSMQLHPKTASS
jgi:hypothetical protein